MVGLVLVLSGKISKEGLFSAYIKTIAEVEVRNTQDLVDVDSQAEIVTLSNVKSLPKYISSIAGAWASSRLIKSFDFWLPFGFCFRYAPSHQFFISSPIRAPGLS